MGLDFELLFENCLQVEPTRSRGLLLTPDRRIREIDG